MDIQLTDISRKDVEGLIAIYSQPDLYHSREEASWFVKSFFDYHHIKLAKHGRSVIGALFWNVVEEEHHGLTEIRDFWIDEGFRRRGLGEQLLRLAIEDMKRFFVEHGFALRKVMVTTGEDNVPSRKLIEKVGFQQYATLPDLFARGETELIYVVTLNP